MNEENYTENTDIQIWLSEYQKTNDQKVKMKLKSLIAMAYMPLVKKVARSFARRSNDPIEDIVQVGSIGLLKAVDLYLSGRSTSFKTYATYLITGEIRHYLRDKTSMIRAPREIKELSYRVHKITVELTEKYGHSPTDEELAKALSTPKQKIKEVNDLERRTSTVSIDQIVSSDKNNTQGASLAEKIPDTREDDNREIFENRMILDEAVETLPDEEKQIVEMRFYDGLNQREISDKLNISQMQVSRKMKHALTKLFEYCIKRGVVSCE